MKVSTREIMNLGNPQHEDFGTFAKFITGMGTHVHIQDVMYICNKCSRPVYVLDENDPHNPKNQVCGYCIGKKEGLAEKQAPKTLASFYTDHEHQFSNGKNNPCKVCGIFKGVAGIVLEPTPEVTTP